MQMLFFTFTHKQVSIRYNSHAMFHHCVYLVIHSCYRRTDGNHSSTTEVYCLFLMIDRLHNHGIPDRFFSRFLSIWSCIADFSQRDDTIGRTNVVPCHTRLPLGMIQAHVAGRCSTGMTRSCRGMAVLRPFLTSKIYKHIDNNCVNRIKFY